MTTFKDELQVTSHAANVNMYRSLLIEIGKELKCSAGQGRYSCIFQFTRLKEKFEKDTNGNRFSPILLRSILMGIDYELKVSFNGDQMFVEWN
jgi:hypothetical protein